MTYIEKGINNDLYAVRIIEGEKENEVYINRLDEVDGSQVQIPVSKFRTEEKNITAIKTMVKVIIADLPTNPAHK